MKHGEAETDCRSMKKLFFLKKIHGGKRVIIKKFCFVFSPLNTHTGVKTELIMKALTLF